MKTQPAKLAVLYSNGGLGDVGRHAILAALERKDVSSIKVLSEHPETLQEKNWNCGCPQDHELTKEELDRIEIIPIKDWGDIMRHFEGVTAVVSCLGNRQSFLGDRVATEGSKAVVDAMKSHGISRVVAMNSVGLGDDQPCLEYHWAGKIMDGLFATVSRRERKDLTGSETCFRESDRDFLLIRPVGLGEDVVPVNEWFLQKEKFKDKVGINMAKLDCARFMVQEALEPTKHRTAVVIGNDPKKDKMLNGGKEAGE